MIAAAFGDNLGRAGYPARGKARRAHEAPVEWENLPGAPGEGTLHQMVRHRHHRAALLQHRKQLERETNAGGGPPNLRMRVDPDRRTNTDALPVHVPYDAGAGAGLQGWLDGDGFPWWARALVAVAGVGALALSAMALKRRRYTFAAVAGIVVGGGMIGRAVKGLV